MNICYQCFNKEEVVGKKNFKKKTKQSLVGKVIEKLKERNNLRNIVESCELNYK